MEILSSIKQRCSSVLGLHRTLPLWRRGRVPLYATITEAPIVQSILPESSVEREPGFDVFDLDDSSVTARKNIFTHLESLLDPSNSTVEGTQDILDLLDNLFLSHIYFWKNDALPQREFVQLRFCDVRLLPPEEFWSKETNFSGLSNASPPNSSTNLPLNTLVLERTLPEPKNQAVGKKGTPLIRAQLRSPTDRGVGAALGLKSDASPSPSQALDQAQGTLSEPEVSLRACELEIHQCSSDRIFVGLTGFERDEHIELKITGDNNGKYGCPLPLSRHNPHRLQLVQILLLVKTIHDVDNKHDLLNRQRYYWFVSVLWRIIAEKIAPGTINPNDGPGSDQFGFVPCHELVGKDPEEIYPLYLHEWNRIQDLIKQKRESIARETASKEDSGRGLDRERPEREEGKARGGS